MDTPASGKDANKQDTSASYESCEREWWKLAETGKHHDWRAARAAREKLAVAELHIRRQA